MNNDERALLGNATTVHVYEAVILAADTVAFLGFHAGVIAFSILNIAWFPAVAVATFGLITIGSYFVDWRGQLSFRLMDHCAETARILEPRQERSSPAAPPAFLFNDPGMRGLYRISFSEEQHKTLRDRALLIQMILVGFSTWFTLDANLTSWARNLIQSLFIWLFR